MPHGFLAVETMTDQMNSLNPAGVMCSYKETKLNGKKSPAEMFFVLFLHGDSCFLCCSDRWWTA